jgi:hypothetical protein
VSSVNGKLNYVMDCKVGVAFSELDSRRLADGDGRNRRNRRNRYVLGSLRAVGSFVELSVPLPNYGRRRKRSVNTC